jgi:hypothetical protein
MTKKSESVLTGVATAIGSTLGAVAGTTDKLGRYVKAKQRVVRKSLRNTARGAKSTRARVSKRGKTVARKIRAKVRRGVRSAA